MLGVSALTLVTVPPIAAFAQTAPAGSVEASSRDTLPPTFRPAAYTLHLDPNLADLTFRGDVSIEGDAPVAGRTIVLNAQGLVLDSARLDDAPTTSITYDTKLGRATLAFARPFAAGHHRLTIAYRGKTPNDSTVGIFAMDYKAEDGARRTLATNLEPAEARRVFPGWDEPGLKATFTVSIDAPADRMALSNMPEVSSTLLPDGRKRMRFATSPRMSTYLFFASIGDYERIHREVDGVDVGVVVRRGDTMRAAFALDQATALLRYYNDYFGIRYPLPKLDLIAAPGEITGGAMENWGAILYSQELVLLDPVRGNEDDRQHVFRVIAHEMAHQWFGDLVTMDWWDSLWLNEGFARWMQTRAADALHPEWKTGLQAAGIFESGKRADAQASTHPVMQPIRSAEQASQSFDDITYNKGAAVVTMLEDYVGPDAFRDGVRRYMRKHAFGNTVDADLWSQIEAAAGKPASGIGSDFTRQPGVPLVRVVSTPGGVTLSEDRFAEDPESLTGQPRTTWRLPLTVRQSDGKAITLLLPKDRTVRGAMPLVNSGGRGYARVAYTSEHAASLAAGIGRFSPMDQLNLMNDAWALGQSGYTPASNLMALIAGLPVDADPVVWRRAVALLSEIDARMGTSPADAAFRKWALRRIAPVASHIGAQPREGESVNAVPLRADLWRAQANFGDATALARAREILDAKSGSPEEQRAAVDILGRTADADTFDLLLLRARATSDPLERMRFLVAMALTTDASLARRMVDIAIGPDAPAGTAARLLTIVGTRNPDVVWSALQPHLAKGDLPFGKERRWQVVPAIAGASALSERIVEVRAYGTRDMPPEARRPIESAVGSIRLNRAIQKQALPEIARWIASQ